MSDMVIVMVIVGVLIAVGVFLWMQKRRSTQLKERFGPEYDHTVQEAGAPRKAEEELQRRVKRVEGLDIHPLQQAESDRFAEEWRFTQARFVDEPSRAVTEADALVMQVMQARGYPVGNFEQRAADVSVDHPRVVKNYRAAREIAQRNKKGEASTEDLRQAMIYYRELFEDLLVGDRSTDQRKERDKEEVLR